MKALWRRVLGARLTGPILTLIAFLMGLAWRWAHVFSLHNPNKFVYSDMGMYVELGKRLARPGYQLRPHDVTHPPGLSELIAYFYRTDPTLENLVRFQFAVTALVPIAVGLLGWLAFDRKAGMWAVVLTSFYLPFVDFGGYFLAEIYMTLTATMTLVCYLGALRVLTPSEQSAALPAKEGGAYRTSGPRPAAAAARTLLGISYRRWAIALLLTVIGGLWFSWGMLMKMVAAPALLSFFGLHAVLTRMSRFKVKALLIAVLLVSTIPANYWQAERCTRGNQGEFCPGSNKAGADFLMGHIGRVQGVVWRDPKSRGTVGFGSPAAYQHGYSKKAEFNFAITDNRKNRAEAWKWIRKYPGQAIVLSFEHLWDSFGGSLPWPSVATGFWPGSQAFHYLFLAFLFFPTLVLLLDVARSRGLVGLLRSMELAIVAPIFGVAISVMLATGEVRYRIPWDMCFIVAAIQFYRRLKIPLREPVEAGAGASAGASAGAGADEEGDEHEHEHEHEGEGDGDGEDGGDDEGETVPTPPVVEKDEE